MPARPSLKKQTAGWLLETCERERRAETGERISEEAPGGPPGDPDDYHTTVASVILHTLRHTVERNSQTQKQSKLQWASLSFPDLIIAAPIIAVIFIIVLSIYGVCFHHSNNVTLEFPCREREGERDASQGVWRRQLETRGSASWIHDFYFM